MISLRRPRYWGAVPERLILAPRADLPHIYYSPQYLAAKADEWGVIAVSECLRGAILGSRVAARTAARYALMLT